MLVSVVRSRPTRVLAVLLGLAWLVAGLSIVVQMPPARADIAPDPGTPTTVTADALPTAQIDGVAWSQVIVGNTVYVAGSFSSARPAGVALGGSGQVARSNLMAYNLITGQIVQSWAPTTNAQVRAITASPDGSRLYIGGDFTQVNGVTRSRIAALDTATGNLITSFAPLAATVVRAVVATNSTVYFGGDFNAVNYISRGYVAAASASNGALLDWNPNADAPVWALTLTYDKTKLIIGGAFGTMSGTTALGMASVDPTTGALNEWDATQVIQNGGVPSSAITSLAADADGVYGTGYNYSATGHFLEGSFEANPDNGAIKWIEDCHGDNYSVYPDTDAVYIAGHPHYCGNIGGFPQTDPWTFHHSLAFGKTVTGTIAHDPYGYPDFYGNPHPALLNWFPEWVPGTYTGQGQAGWSVVGSGKYVVYGGEFTKVNGTAQQGLVRFATSDVAPDKMGPKYSSTLVPGVQVKSPTSVRVSFGETSDPDNESLTYKVYRNFQSLSDTPIYQTTAKSTFWNMGTLGFVDNTVQPGKKYNYRVYVYDSSGNSTTATATVVTMPTSMPATPYADAVEADGPDEYYRMNETTGTSTFDWANFNDATNSGGVTMGTPGAVDGDTAYTFDGSDDLVATRTPIAGPNTFSVEAWFKTTSTTGGKIVGFGNNNSGLSSSYDRHVYMDPSGHVVFGVYPGSMQTLQTSGSYNDGQWHQVVASLGPNGMSLYLDGRVTAKRSDITYGQDYSGYWRIGGDSAWSGANYFTGSIDDVSIYPSVLTRQQVNAHWMAAGHDSTLPSSPSDAYGAAVFGLNPDLYWRLDETSGTTAADAGPNTNNGSIQGGVTLGGSSAITGTTGASAAFDGGSGIVVATQGTSNPTNYSESIWFKTTTTSGGKLLGFGNATSGLSSNYDRHIYMQDNGQLVFGTWTSGANTITSPSAYNDGAWHQVVATQSTADGMKMYVDGQLVGTNGETGAQAYDGYWRIGGDNTWGSSSPFFNGGLDEAAVFGSVLTPDQVAYLYAVGTGHNLPPTAAFGSSITDLSASFDASGSSDGDGTIASYAWDFGDGTTGSGKKPDHAYTTPGTYHVTLTVTDDDGATASVTHDVTATAADVPPTASFTSTVAEMAVSFDGTASSDSDGSLASYAWDLGDGTTATGATVDHTYTAGGTYHVTLTVTDDRGATGSVTHDVTVVAPNVAPTAAFTTQAHALQASFDGSGSSDSDGSVASYAWDFGDGHTGSGVSPSHTYDAAGSYTVTLTVTDDDGATATVSHGVTVSANVKPVAAFTSSVSGLAVSLDGSGSSDSDGSVASYAWDFGDGASGTGVSPSHTYGAAGTYTVTLTVTDDDGATDAVTHAVSVTAPAAGAAFAQDAFGRSVASGWGTADTGGAWTVTGGAANFSVSGGLGVISIPKAATGPGAYLNAVSQTDSDVSAEVSVPVLPNAGSVMAALVGRGGSANGYRQKIRITNAGAVSVVLSKVVSGTETDLVSKSVPGLTYVAGDTLAARAQVTGTSPTTIRLKVWKKGTAEPADWSVSTTDATAGLQSAGGVGVWTYASGSTTNVPLAIQVDNYLAQATTTTPTPPQNVKPVAAFTSSVSGLAVSLDGSGSSDSDGSVASYAWDFGDGASGTGVSPSHTYGAAGTYTVTLTVTDDDGATDAVTHAVSVTAPAAGAAFAQDAFGRSVASGWGTADTGGAWTVTGGAANFSVSGGLGVISIPKAATGPGAYLNAVSQTDSDVSAEVSVPVLPNAGSVMAALVGRGGSANGYRQKIRITNAGAVSVVLSKVVSGTETDLVSKSVPGLTYVAGDTLAARAQVTGTSPTTIRLKVWKKGTAEPADWSVSTTDATAGLQSAGGVGVWTYASGSTTNVPLAIQVDNYLAQDPN